MLRLPDGEYLKHGESVYDPVKAREYYLRTRKLKGRKKGSDTVSTGIRTGTRSSVGNAITVKFDGKEYKLTQKQYAEQKAYAAVRVKRINEKIRTLERALKIKLAEARKKERENKKPDTAAEKNKKAKEAEKYRDKNQQKLKNAAKKAASKKKTVKEKPNLNTVEGLKTAIADAQASLRRAVERQRALTSAEKG